MGMFGVGLGGLSSFTGDGPTATLMTTHPHPPTIYHGGCVGRCRVKCLCKTHRQPPNLNHRSFPPTPPNHSRAADQQLA